MPKKAILWGHRRKKYVAGQGRDGRKMLEMRFERVNKSSWMEETRSCQRSVERC